MSSKSNAMNSPPNALQRSGPVSNIPGARITAILSEPLLHFLLIGALLFCAYTYLQNDTRSTPQSFVVSAGKIEHLASLFSRTWQRPPTRVELEGLIDDYVREEIAYREGMKMGLDQDDTIIRRRIRQKLDFIADDLGSQIEPTEEQLTTFLNENPDSYRIDPRITFRQVFLDPERHALDLQESVAKLLDTLKSDPTADAEQLGDQTLLEYQNVDRSKREVANNFGPQFAEEIVKLPLQLWHGPIRSAYGVHAVYISERTDGRLPPLSEVRDLVRRDWEQKHRQDLVESFYEELMKKYEVAIELPDSPAEEP
jgi:hypothetical protein